MSESPEHQDDDLPESFETRVIAQLAVYSTSKDAKGKVKESKTKNKGARLHIFGQQLRRISSGSFG